MTAPEPLLSDRPRYHWEDEHTWRTPTATIKMKPGIGPVAFGREAGSVVRQLQSGETVTVEMAVRTSNRARHAASVKVLDKVVALVEGVGEVQTFDTGEWVRPKVVLVPVSPPSAAAGSTVPASPRMPR